jgi:hypothetical protein
MLDAGVCRSNLIVVGGRGQQVAKRHHIGIGARGRIGERRIRACFPEKEFGRETILHARSIEFLERTPANVNSCKS